MRRLLLASALIILDGGIALASPQGPARPMRSVQLISMTGSLSPAREALAHLVLNPALAKHRTIRSPGSELHSLAYLRSKPAPSLARRRSLCPPGCAAVRCSPRPPQPSHPDAHPRITDVAAFFPPTLKLAGRPILR